MTAPKGTTTTEKIRVAIVGTGYIAHYHARAAHETAGAELVAVAGTSLEKARGFAEKHQCARAYDHVDALAADDEIDAVVLATPNRLHLPHGRQLMEAGKHLLVDKPMATDAASGEQMKAVARAQDRRLLVGHQWRFDREALYLKAAIDRGDLGTIVKVKSYGIHANWGPSGWFTRKADAGGGALIDMGVHAIDTVRFLLGDPEPASVYARIETHFGDYDVDDLGVIVINWKGTEDSASTPKGGAPALGAVTVIESGWWNPHMDGPEASTQLFGTRGYARLFPTEVTRIRNHEPDTERPEFPARAEHCDQHIYTGQMGELVAAIEARRDPVPGPDHGLAVLRICDAAYRSAATGQVVPV